ncbi:DUF3047 domain-containing protein [Caldovatus aquaticus]|uniref:DUF3047 domain-containing protein n=1 Tax=Caldovatus aquaticus TaxID=2865671 RepID=A0ABS7F001_9PROT|nr:DUF3047 domain-containing protein [Caldovatus aquaticus]MBW8268951.1 DUF3047 domain-containing protein [Caldovatus aquaticus]
MRRPTAAPALCLAALAPLLAAAAERLPTPPDLAAAGWQAGAWRGMPSARFGPLPLRLQAGGATVLPGVWLHAEPGEGGFVWRPLAGRPACLSWRWRVEEGPPPTDLARRGGDDRAISISVGFDGWPPGAGVWVRTQHAAAQALAGDGVPLPRSVLTYVWGGSGREPGPFFANPWLGGVGRVRVLRPAGAPRGVWVEERVDLAADWRRAFGGQDPPPLVKITIGTDADDTRSRVRAAVEDLRLGPCR